MGTKSELTTKYIIETVAPIFNRLGYKGASLSELTRATKLTKGAIYGNFESKEDLAVQAFTFNVRKVIWPVADKMNAEPTATRKLFALTAYYRDYYKMTKKNGGCPLLNVGVDSKHQNPALAKRVKEIVGKLVNNIKRIIEDGISNGEFRADVDARKFSMRILSTIEGASYTATIMDDGQHMANMMNHLDEIFEKELTR